MRNKTVWIILVVLALLGLAIWNRTPGAHAQAGKTTATPTPSPTPDLLVVANETLEAQLLDYASSFHKLEKDYNKLQASVAITDDLLVDANREIHDWKVDYGELKRDHNRLSETATMLAGKVQALELEVQRLSTMTVMVPADAPPAQIITRTVPVQTNDGCIDGQPEPISLVLDRIPYGLRENASIGEVAWQPGTGFAKWDRVVLMVPALENTYQVFLLQSGTTQFTANLRRYCGTISQVQDYAVDPMGHILASRDSSADGDGHKPAEDEISVFMVDIKNGGLQPLKLAPNGPDPSLVASHVQIVRLAEGTPNAAEQQPVLVPTATPTPAAIIAVEVITRTNGATPVPTLQPTAQPAAGGTCTWTNVQIPHSWDGPSKPTMTGPFVVNFGQPGTDTVDKYRMGVPNNITIRYKVNIGGSQFPYQGDGCDLVKIMQEATWDAGSLEVISPQQAVDLGLIEIVPAPEG